MHRSTSLMLVLMGAFTLFAVSANAQNLLVNGNFASGSLAPWVPFTTSNGTNGSGLPDVVMFSGGTDSAHFNVGEVNYDMSQQGGGLSQIVMVSTAGTYNYSARFASRGGPLSNADAGTFSILIDGTTVATKFLGGIGGDQILRGSLSGPVMLTAGSHTFVIQITRAYTSDTETPNEAVTNLSLALAADVVHRR